MISLDIRPHTFDDMIGQKRIISEFKSLSKNMSFPPFMIMEGPTGTGKTTASLIIAQLLNCENPIVDSEGNKSPCQKCEPCLDIVNEKFSLETKRIDCSDMGKDDVLKLKDKLSIRPAYSNKRVLILDEAQNLSSSSARGALLLLLEKKYTDCYLILNTMDISKFDAAIIKRTQHYKFKKITEDDIGEYILNKIAKLVDPDETLIPIEFYAPNSALNTIIKNSQGSVRAVLQDFERCINGKIFTNEAVIEEFGYCTLELADTLLLYLLDKNPIFFHEYNKYDNNKKENKEFFFNFFMMSWSALIRAEIFLLNPTVIDSDFMENKMKRLSSHKNLHELLSVFSSIQTKLKGYNDSKVFLSEIILYYRSMPNGVTKSIEAPSPPIRRRERIE